MGLLDDLVKLQYMTPLYNVLGRTLEEANRQKMMEKSIPHIREMIDQVTNLQTTPGGGGYLDPNEVRNIALKTYSDILQSTQGRLPQANEAIKSIWESVLESATVGSQLKHQAASTGYLQQGVKEKEITNQITALTGLDEAKAKIDLAQAQTYYYRNRSEADQKLRKLEENLSQSRDRAKLASTLKLQIEAGIGDDPELAKALTPINIDDYLNERKIDFAGLAEAAAKNINPDWQNMNESMKKDEIFKYRARIANTLLGDVERQRRATTAKILERLLAEKNQWDNNILNVRQNPDTGEMERIPFPDNYKIDILMRSLYGNESVPEPEPVKDPILEESERIMNELKKNQPSSNTSSSTGNTSTPKGSFEGVYGFYPYRDK